MVEIHGSPMFAIVATGVLRVASGNNTSVKFC